MKYHYSKPFSDINTETETYIKKEKDIRDSQKKSLLSKTSAAARSSCTICSLPLSEAAQINHRSVPYCVCSTCGHIQSREIIREVPDQEFETIYPALDKAGWESRMQRIYEPKLDWILNALSEARISQKTALSYPWLDIGAGAGYFLGALKKKGASLLQGIEASTILSKQANEMLGAETVTNGRDIKGKIKNSGAKIVSSFFVFEHLEDNFGVYEALASREKGSILVFSVPVYGFASMIEMLSETHSARSLDGTVHRQLFTDTSITYLLQQMGYQAISQWIFGQDALDLKRAIMCSIEGKYDTSYLNKITEMLNPIMDPLQQLVDTSHLADARHVLAIKE
jgi:hypothetical protein